MAMTATKHLLADLTTTSDWHVPPECQGQMVEVSYGCTASYIYVRSLDRSDRTVTITAHEHPETETDWDPWNRKPDLGDEVGVVWSGKECDEPQRD